MRNNSEDQKIRTVLMRRHKRNNMQDIFNSLKVGNDDFLKKYKNNGGDLNILDDTGKSLLIHCISENDIYRAKQLLDLGCSVNLGTKSKLCPLHMACQVKNLEMVRLLIENGGDITAKTDIGRTPLMQAILSGSIDIVQELLLMRSDVNGFDNTGNTPLQLALLTDRHDIADLLLSHSGIDLSLSFRCRMDEHFIPITEYLLHHGADPFTEMKSGYGRKSFFQAMLDLEIVSSQVISTSFEHVYYDIYTEYGNSTASYTNNKIIQEMIHCKPIARLFDIELTLQISVDRTVNRILNKFLTMLKTLTSLGLIFPPTKDIWTCDQENRRLVDILNQLKGNSQFWNKVKELQTSPPSLMQQCRTAIRSQLNFGVSNKVEKLPLPQQMKKYLCFPEIN